MSARDQAALKSVAAVPSGADDARAILERLGVRTAPLRVGGPPCSPITGEVIAQVHETSADEAKAAIGRAHEAFMAWRKVPAPRRGEFVRLLGEELRAAKADLGRLVTLEAGKVTSEGLGEVQEMIDICDFAVGLSRQLYGLTIATERAEHRMMETWHPLGVFGVISAFNFPVAVWSWNAALAFVCGDSVVWKPSEKTPLTALAVQAIFDRAAERFGGVPEGLSEVLHRRPRGRRGAGRGRARADRVRHRFDRHGPPGRPQARQRVSLAPSSNSAATTPPSWRPPPISIWRCAASRSPPWERPVSAARRCVVCSCMRASTTRSFRAL